MTIIFDMNQTIEANNSYLTHHGSGPGQIKLHSGNLGEVNSELGIVPGWNSSGYLVSSPGDPWIFNEGESSDNQLVYHFMESGHLSRLILYKDGETYTFAKLNGEQTAATYDNTINYVENQLPGNAMTMGGITPTIDMTWPASQGGNAGASGDPFVSPMIC